MSGQRGTKRRDEASNQGPDGPPRKRTRIGEPATIDSTTQHETNSVAFGVEEASQPGAGHAYPPQSPRRGVRLIQVYPEKDEADTDIDIIAIHGLDTKSPETWTWKKGPNDPGVNWLSDPYMLPSKVGPARIFTCDWPADLLQPSDLVQKTKEELALLLFNGIQNRPPATSKQGEDRPIFFIASCLGGIILIKALVDTGETYDAIRRATRGILFLATPFRGTSFQEVAAWAERGLKARASFRGQEVNNLLDSVKGSTFDLEALVRKFTHLAQHKNPPCLLFNFYELGKTSLLRKGLTWLPDWLANENLLVDRSSATLDVVQDPLPLDRSHVLMNKFGGPKCADYESVAGKIQKMLKEICEASPLEQADAWIRDNHYTTGRLKIERLSGEQLWMDQCYINLAIVEQPGRGAARFEEGSEKGDTPPQSSPFSLSARLKIETPDKNIRVELATLFNPRKGSNGQTSQPRRILIRGRAGVGKTTLCKKMIHDFIHHRTWKDLFDRILWMPLRTLKRKPDGGYNLEGLFLRDFFSQSPKGKDLAKRLWHALDATQSARTLFILDGLDEVSEGLDRESEMHTCLEFLLKQPNVIITSRPSASLPDDLRPDLELETIGFYPDQVTEYVEKTLRDPSKVDEIQLFLQQRPLIRGLVRIPIQLDALCFTWDSRSRSAPAPETMTQLYEDIELKLWRKDRHRIRQWREPAARSARTRQEIKRGIEDTMDLLEFFAFCGLCSDVINFDSTHRDDIYGHFTPSSASSAVDKPFDDALAELSFLRTSDPSSENRSTTYHFLHLTFQEYFAARYFARQWEAGQKFEYLDFNKRKTGKVETDPRGFLQQHKYNARYDVFWRFVAGLLHAHPDQLCRFFRTIEDQPRDILGPVHQRLVMHCLSEVAPSQDIPGFNQLREDLQGPWKQWLLLECNLRGHSQLAAEMGFPEQILGDVLKEASKDVKKKILRSLNAKPYISPAILQAVGASLKDPDSYVRFAAAEALGVRADLPEAILQAVAASLKDPDSNVRSAAARALGVRADLPEAILQAVAASLKDPDSYVRSAAAGALGVRADLPEAILQAVAASLEDPDLHVRSAAAEALGGRADLPEAILQAVAASLKDPDLHVRSAAAEALGVRADLPEAILQAVAASLKDPDSYVRFTAARALGVRADLPEAILQAVAALLKDPDSYVRSAAARALGVRADLPEAILQAVAASLKDPDWQVRSAAARALAGRADLPEAILQAVAASLKDPDSDVRSAAAKALKGQLDYFFLCTMDSQSFNNFYGFLLRESFSNYLTWFVKGNNSSINMPEGGRDVPFNQLKSKVQEAQAFLKVPLKDL